MGDSVKQILAKPIHLTDQIIQAADDVTAFKHECGLLKSVTEKLASLLRQAARESNHLYERPARRIIDATVKVLDKALALVLKYRAHGLMKHVVTINPAAHYFRRMSSLLENSISDVSWLLRVSASADDLGDEYLGVPPIAANEPILCLIWEMIAILYTGSADGRSDAAASLVSLARDNDRYGKLIIEEGGVGPLLKLLKEGESEGQENAARVIGLLGRDAESVEHMIHAGVCSVFAKILKEGAMKAQAATAWAISELAANYPKCQDQFAQHNIIRLLVSHLAFETVREHSNRNGNGSLDDEKTVISHSLEQNNKAREMEDPVTKGRMKAMAARALWQLAKGNSPICISITLSRALWCFAVLLEKRPEEFLYYLAMALMEITAVAEKDPELRRSAFRPHSPACKAVVDQLVRVIKQPQSELLIPCIRAVGNLATTFKATETRMISPLVELLDETEAEVSKEACIALTKFACPSNHLHLDHSKAIIHAGGAKHLVQLVWLEEQIVQSSALHLLCYIAMHVPESEELAAAEVPVVLKWAAKVVPFFENEDLLHLAIMKMELYQPRGYH